MSRKCRQMRRDYLERQRKSRKSKRRKVMSRGRRAYCKAYDDHAHNVAAWGTIIQTRPQTQDTIGQFRRAINTRNNIGHALNAALPSLTADKAPTDGLVVPPMVAGTDVLHQVEMAISSIPVPNPALVDREHFITRQLIEPYDSVLRDTMNKLVDENTRTKNAIAKLAEEMRGRDNIQGKKQSEIDRLTGVVDGLRKEMNDRGMKGRAELKDLLLSHSTRLQDLHKQHQNNRATLVQERLADKLAALKDIADLKQQMNALKGVSQENKLRVARLQSEAELHGQATEAAALNRVEKNGAIARLTGEAAAAQGLIARLRGELDAHDVLTGEADASRQALLDRNGRIAELTGEAAAAQGAIARLRGELDSHDVEKDGVIARLTGEAAAAQGAIARLRGELDSHDVEKDGVIARLTGEAEAAQQAFLSRNGVIAKLRGEVDSLEQSAEAAAENRRHALEELAVCGEQKRAMEAKMQELGYRQGVAEASQAAMEAASQQKGRNLDVALGRVTELTQQHADVRNALLAEAGLRQSLDTRLEAAEGALARNRAKFTTNKDSLERTVRDLMSNKLREHEQLVALQEQMEGASVRDTDTIMQLRGALKREVESGEQQQRDLDGMRAEIAAEKQGLADMQAQLNAEAQAKAEALVQLEALRHTGAGLEGQVAEWRNKTAAALLSAQAKNQNLEVVRAQLASEGRRVEELQSALDADRRNHALVGQEAQSLRGQLQAEASEKARLQQELEAAGLDGRALQEAVRQGVANKAAVNATVRRLEQALADQQAATEQQVGSLQAETDALRAASLAGDGRVAGLEEQLAAVEAQSQSLVASLRQQVTLAETKASHQEDVIRDLHVALDQAQQNLTHSGETEVELATAQETLHKLEEQLRQNEEVMDRLRAGHSDMTTQHAALAAALEEKDVVVEEQNKKLLLATSEALAQQDRLDKLRGAHDEVVREVEVTRAEAAKKLAAVTDEAARQHATKDAKIKEQAAGLLTATEHMKTMDAEHEDVKQQLQQLLADGLLDQVKLDDHALRIEQLMQTVQGKQAELEAGRAELVRGRSEWEAALALKDQVAAEHEEQLVAMIKKASDDRQEKANELARVTKQLEQATRELGLAEDEVTRHVGRADPTLRRPEVDGLRSILEELVSLTEGRNREGYMRNIDWLADSSTVNQVMARERQLKQALRKLKSAAYVCVVVNTWDRDMKRFAPLNPAQLRVEANTVTLDDRLTFNRFYSADVWTADNSIHDIYNGVGSATSLRDMVGDTLKGGSSVLFTYGLSGSGKTQALFGDPSEGSSPGLMLSALDDLEASGASVVHEQDVCLYGTFDVPSLVARAIVREATQLATLTHRDGLLVSSVLPVPGALHLPGAPVSQRSILQTLKEHPQIRRTPNNDRSSRGHLFMTWRVTPTAGPPGFLTFIDMAGAESPRHIAEVYDLEALQKQRTPLKLDQVRPAAFYDTMKREYKATDPKLKQKLMVHTVMTEGFFINETLNQLADFFHLERGQPLPSNRPTLRIDGPWNEERTRKLKFDKSVYTADMMHRAYVQDGQPTGGEDPDPVGFVRQLLSIKRLGEQSSVFTMIAVANPFAVSGGPGVLDTLLYAQRL